MNKFKREENNRGKIYRDLFLIVVLSFILTLTSILFIDEVVDLTVLKSFLNSPIILVMNFIPLLILMFILYFLTGRLDLSFLLLGSIVFIMGIANQNTLFYRNDNIRASDLLFLKEAKTMLGQGLSIRFHKLYFIYPIFLIGVGLIIGRDKSLLSKKIRALAGFIFLFIGLVSLYTIMIERDTYWNNSMGRYHPYIEVERAKDRGMIYTFVYGYRDLLYRAPEDYDPEEIENFLAQYQESMPEEEDRIDIIAIMGESYADLESIGAQVSPKVYAPLRGLQEKSFFGKLQNYTFGGGTIETERNFLVGVYDHGPYIKPRNSFVWMLRDQGYNVEAMHPHTGKFYNRLNTNGYLGMDKFYYDENFFHQYHEEKEDYFPDKTLFPIILDKYNARDKSRPYFNFVVSIQNHTPYSPENLGLGEYLDRKSFKGTGEEYNMANNYFRGIMDTGNHLLELTNKLETKKDPVVVIFFGDHLARLGPEGQVYEMMGVNTKLDNKEGWLNNYTTPYIVWANTAAKEIIGGDIKGQGPHMSNYYLFGYILDGLGYKTPYIQYLRERVEDTPIDASSYMTENGKLTSHPSQETIEKKNLHERIQYYRNTNFKYQDLID